MSVFFSFPVALEEEVENQKLKAAEPVDPSSLNGKQRHQLKHRELFLSRQVETIPATHIRGKCSVTLLNETESLLSYLNKDVSITSQCTSYSMMKIKWYLSYPLLSFTGYLLLLFGI